MPFMQLVIYKKGRLASCECSKCGSTIYWHEWANGGQVDDVKYARCDHCCGMADPSTYWESRSRNWYAGRYSAPGYLDCTDMEYDTNLARLKRTLRDLYGDDQT